MSLMLATSSKMIASSPDVVVAALHRQGGWAWEVKLDGARASLALGEKLRLRSRQGHDITSRYPEVVEAVTGAPLACILDGELVVLDDRGRPDFSALQRGVRPVKFSAFDVLEREGISLRMMPWHARREHLDAIAEEVPGILLFPWSPDGRMMWRFATRHRLEGLMAKRLESKYVGRRSKDWVKVRLKRSLNAFVVGSEPGRGERASTFGALNLALFHEDGSLEPIGKVGAGFANRDLREITQLLANPLRNFVVNVEFLGVSPSGRLRSPVFKGIVDVPLTSCSVDQLVDDEEDRGSP